MPDAFSFDALVSYLVIGAALMALGMLGFLTRRNLIVMFLSVEMMLQGTALTLVGFGRYHGNWTGQVFTIVILTVAASEAAIALALILILFHRRASLDVSLWQDLREPGQPAIVDRLDEFEPGRWLGAGRQEAETHALRREGHRWRLRLEAEELAVPRQGLVDRADDDRDVVDRSDAHGRCSPQTPRRAFAISPSVTSASTAARMRGKTFSVPDAAPVSAASAAAAASASR